jgi:hypothetical protein
VWLAGVVVVPQVAAAGLAVYYPQLDTLLLLVQQSQSQ